MKEINLSGNNKHIIFLIDDIDYERVIKHKWYLHDSGYIRGRLGYIHHFIIGRPPKGYEVDHINLNKLDNTRSNLKFVTIKENRQHKKIYFKNNIKYAQKRGNRYYSQVTVKRKTIHLGVYDSPFVSNKVAVDYLFRIHDKRGYKTI